MFDRSTTRRPVRIPLVERAEEVVSSLSHTGRALFLLLSFLILFSAAGLLFTLNREILVSVPLRGGSLSEGVVGSPRFINPILAISDADRDLSSLVYSGLLRAQPDGTFIPDLAENYDISPDGRTYTFYLRKNVVFQDGTPVTADDILFTVSRAQDPAVKSPELANWAGVAITKMDERTVEFTLKNAYAPFIENLTLGILPRHLWQNVSADEFPFSELNTAPVGSGPYKVEGLQRTPSGIPSVYKLVSFSRYSLGQPYLSNLELHFYQSEGALISSLRGGDIESASSISPAALGQLKGFNIASAPLDRVFGVFFNQNQSAVLRDKTVRQALNGALNREELVRSVLSGYGTPVATPIPPSVLRGADAAASSTDPIAQARSKLLNAGWTDDNGVLVKTSGKGKSASTQRLAFTISTGNVPELRAAAEYLKGAWGKMGAEVSVQIYDQGDLSQNVIRPRKYDALLFGEVVGRGLDLFAFWHSSQRNDPGLNIALYANATVDSTLEKLREAQTEHQRQDLYQKFEAEIDKDVPAVFLYAPDFVYVVPKDVRGLDLGFVSTPADRYLSVRNWYRETDSVWPFFTSEVAR